MGRAGKKISVIVPVYKTEAYLRRCVDSLLRQAYSDMEIILVEDGSPDGCPALCDFYARKDGRVKALHKENGGLVSAWQAGAEASSGDYLCFVDSDDWVEKDMLEDMSEYLSDGPGDAKEIICCNFVINRPGKETKHYHRLAPGTYTGKRLEKRVKNHLLGHENRTVSMSRCMKLFSKSLIMDNRKYSDPEVTMGEDVNITLPALLDCNRLVIMEDALYYHYFYHDKSMVHQYDSGMYAGIQTLYRKVREIYRVKGRENGQRQADREYIYLLLLALKNEIRGAKAGYMDRVKSICLNRKNRGIVAHNPVGVSDFGNRMLYFALRHPAGPVILGVRAVFWLYGKKPAWPVRGNGKGRKRKGRG